MKRKTETDGVVKERLNLAKTLEAFDRRNYQYYDDLSDEFKKQFAPFVLMRFMSSAPNQGGMHEFFLQMTNHYVNKEFWLLSKYPDFQHLLLCLCGMGTKQFHKWIPNKKEKTKWLELFKETHKDLNELEIKILRKQLTSDEILETALGLGKTNKEAKEYVKSFEETK